MEREEWTNAPSQKQAYAEKGKQAYFYSTTPDGLQGIEKEQEDDKRQVAIGPQNYLSYQELSTRGKKQKRRQVRTEKA